ncbi:hypothetical protein EXIGLDRAFT_721159 [Exidia glandulosa HHB12029]|uniref:Uncharacterized protein n=1 Tax=Exidia glandulosa HHB12029 TaxID=1314781 RepID=A0A165FXC6_EXIGL|nr:hypothetical protein EXIGLDRAFT_721159 [Exidia glandulosa HHB12029]
MVVLPLRVTSAHVGLGSVQARDISTSFSSSHVVARDGPAPNSVDMLRQDFSAAQDKCVSSSSSATYF